jgi:hypothetical protein
MSPSTRPKKGRRRRSRDIWRHVFVVATIGGFLTLGYFDFDDIAAATHLEAKPAEAAQQRAAMYTGSILYVPDSGLSCRQMLFDNQTGRLSDNGQVDCARAAYDGASETRPLPTARAKVISDAFRQR